MSIRLIEIQTEDGSCPTRVARPEGAGPWPGVLMYMDGIGIRPAMEAIAERVAAGGYYVILPDLFYRAGPYTAPDPLALFADEKVRGEWFKRISTHANPTFIMRDTPAFLAHLEAQPEVRQPKVGVHGYCMGGRLAITAAAHFPERIAAAAAFHPGNVATDAPDSPHLLAKQIRARVVVAGAMNDPTFSDEQKQRLEQALGEAGVEHVVETWPARHGWVPTDTPVHDAALAERHFEVLAELYRTALA